MITETTASDPEPAWFRSALRKAPVHNDVDVDDARVHLRCWGETRNPGILFVHGGGAHSGWWDHIAPFFARTHRVVAVDLTGHGDSDHRPTYNAGQWATECIRAAAAGGIDQPPFVVGHSMGGHVTAALAANFPGATRGQMIIDSPLDRTAPKESRLRRPRKLHPSAQEISARFSLTPSQEVLLPYVRDHVVAQSIRRTDAGWVWKFDPDFLERHAEGGSFGLRDLLPKVRTPTLFLRSEHGLVTDAMATAIDDLIAPIQLAELPDAGHHPMMDQPLALVTAIRVFENR